MKKIVTFIRSLLCTILTTFVSVFLAICLFVFIPFYKFKVFDVVAHYWCRLMLFIVKITVGIDSKIIGFEKMEKGKSYVIVGKHESAWDTLIMHTLMKPAPVFILKKQLLWIPFFGWTLALSSKIAIDRKAGPSAIKKMLRQGKKYSQEGHNIIIFPQGTRVPYNSTCSEDYPYKVGVIALVKELGIDVVPMALDSGKLWAKGQFMKTPGTITMEFMDPIKYDEVKDMTKETLLLRLQNEIETKARELASC